MEEIQLQSKKPPVETKEQPQTPKKKKRSFNDFFSVAGVLILAPLIAVFLTFFVFQSYVVDGPSMENTLHHEDRLIVWKAQKTFSKIFGKDFIPGRYSIIVFEETGATSSSTSNSKQLIKRVIGVPGDRVVIKDGSVIVYNEQNKDGFYPDRSIPHGSPLGSTDGTVDYTVKPGEVYVLGDHRNNSLDSRAFGPVKSSDIVGTLAVRIYPFSKIEKF